MSIPSVGNTNISSVPDTTNNNSSSRRSATGVTQDEFLKMFISQLQHQSPLDPLKGHEFIAQLAQFTSLEQLTQLNSSFSDIFKFQQLVGGAGLVGKTVEFISPLSGEQLTGDITSIEVNGDSISAIIQNEIVPITSITKVLN